MKLTIVLNGGPKSCCSTYSPQYVHEIVQGWLKGISTVKVIDIEKETWNPDELAAFAIKCFERQAYPFIYIHELLMDIGRVPPKEELVAMLSQESKRGITRDDLEDAARRYGKIMD